MIHPYKNFQGRVKKQTDADSFDNPESKHRIRLYALQTGQGVTIDVNGGFVITSNTLRGPGWGYCEARMLIANEIHKISVFTATQYLYQRDPILALRRSGLVLR